MEVTEEKFKKLSAQILSTSSQDDSWLSVLQELSEIAGGARTFLFSQDLFDNRALRQHWVGCSDDFVQSWKDYYSGINPWANGAKDVTVGTVLRESQYYPEDQLLKTEFYNDWIKPQENIKHGSAVVAYNNGRVMWLIGGLIRARDTDRYHEPFHRLLTLLAPQIQHVITTNETLNAISFERDVFSKKNIKANSAIFVINEKRKIVYANAAAETLLKSSDAIVADEKGRLHLLDFSAMRNFETAMQQIKEQNIYSFTMRKTQGTDQKLDFTLFRSQVSGSNTGLFGWGDHFAEPGILVTISEQADETVAIQNIKNQFCLTNAEASVTYSIYKGITINEYAKSHSLSIHTVRNQVKAALSKTGSRRQSDLVRLINKAINP
ncbi:helix-turn-helix transcriptional regulator [Pseudaestuariivita rosea]|uniref:helix-turn-helix transcriptional regulator n=1 Tax=Pseudaestuariivita rosea TaxID=2763263 RepID=UPI001ABBA871|nr:helix-turn-helix transcriptional regulator [Pseudaestuariivita rosea]